MRFQRGGLIATAFLLACLGTFASEAQPLDFASVIEKVNAAVKARNDRIAAYTVTEHYAVYRGKDVLHPAAEMTVHTTYSKDSGKKFEIVSEDGSKFIRKHVLGSILDSERELSLPENRKRTWLTPVNYAMKLLPGGVRRIDGRDCLALDISPKRKALHMLAGTLWVDAKDGSIVRIEGTAAQSPTIFAKPARMMRQYARISGFGMATHAKAVSDSALLGRTTVIIDYQDYQIQLFPEK
jgi:outer membrane lipoprotein-sorting protein